MKLLHRIAYYLGGFAIGIIILLFFLGGKRASCDYGPNARTLKNIRNKERFVQEPVLETLREHELDTSSISELLQRGNVLFSESETHLDSCNIYRIEGSLQNSNHILKITVQNCEAQATVTAASIVER
jgi:hypothetical protein